VDGGASGQVCAGGCVGALYIRIATHRGSGGPWRAAALEAATHRGQDRCLRADLAVLAFILVSGGIVAASADAIAKHFGDLAIAAFVLHVAGFVIGYIIPKALRYPESISRAVSIEVGMQNGGMASTLAREHFAAMPLAAAAGVFCGVMQNIIGGIAAAWWKRRPPES